LRRFAAAGEREDDQARRAKATTSARTNTVSTAIDSH
jgi:hypothetical protein